MRKILPVHLAYIGWGVLTGAISGLLGIGGGSLLLPVIHLIYKRDMQVAIGTTLMAIMLGTMSGAIRHATFGNVDWVMAITLGVGAIAGASLIGAPLAEALPSSLLSKLFGGFLCFVGLNMLGVFSWARALLHH